ncbi:3147_t:CDS:2, partial [Entrophospora sp. SA101]
VKSHCEINMNSDYAVGCYGLTKNPETNGHMLILRFVHRDLYPGNILLHSHANIFYVNDMGFCGPEDKPIGGIYGNLPYMAPE